MSMDVPVYSTIEEIAQCLRHSTRVGAVITFRFEMLEKKSFLLFDPLARQLFYIDRLGHPLLPMHKDSLRAAVPAGLQIIDISKQHAELNLYSQAGFHGHQIIYQNAAWYDFARAQIQTQQSLLQAAAQPARANAHGKGDALATDASMPPKAKPMSSIAAKVNSLFGRKRALPVLLDPVNTAQTKPPQKK